MPSTPMRTDGTVRLQSRARFASGFLIAFMIASIVSVIATGVMLLMMGANYLATAGLAITGLIGLVWYVLFFVAGIVFLVWLHRARANLEEAGQPDLQYSPGWSVASFFVPLVNLVVPMRTMRELYNRSMGEDPDLCDASAPPVASWWTCHLAGSLVLVFNNLVMAVDSIPGLYVLTPPVVTIALTVMGTALMIGSAWFLRRSLVEITHAQAGLLNIENTFA